MLTRCLALVVVLSLAGCSGSSTAPSPATSAPAPIVTPPPVIVPVQPPVVIRGPLFDLAFWNLFVHDGFEQPSALVPLRRLVAAPSVYLRTVDDAGQAIDAVTLNATAQALRDVAAQWTGGQFGLAGVTQGTSTMQGQHGWLTVIWDAGAKSYCGLSDVAVDGGVIELAPKTPNCGCPPSISTVAIRPRTVKHELGHAFGYWHTGNAADLMSGLSVSSCDQEPSDRERYHAEIAYRTPVGTTNSLSRSVIVD